MRCGLLPRFRRAADPPITEAQTDYLRAIKPHVTRLFFMLNKADYLVEERRERAMDFLRRVLAREGMAAADIFACSARDGPAARRSNDDAALRASGLAQIEERLVRYLSREKVQTLRTAVARKLEQLLAQAVGDIDLRIRALELPVETLEQRAAAFGSALASIERQRIAAAGDKTRSRRLPGSARTRNAANAVVAERAARVRVIREVATRTLL